MPKYYVLVREVHVSHLKVEADSPEEAIAKVAKGDEEFEDDCLEFSHTLDTDTWTTEERED